MTLKNMTYHGSKKGGLFRLWYRMCRHNLLQNEGSMQFPLKKRNKNKYHTSKHMVAKRGGANLHILTIAHNTLADS